MVDGFEQRFSLSGLSPDETTPRRGHRQHLREPELLTA